MFHFTRPGAVFHAVPPLSRVLATVFFCQAVLAVLLLAILVPPFQNSDEFNHLKRVEQIAAGTMIAGRLDDGKAGGCVDPGFDRIDAILGAVRFPSDRKVTRDMLRSAGAIGWSACTETSFSNTAIYAPFLYLPAATGLLAGKYSGLSIVRTLMLARATGGLVSAAVASLAIAISGEAAALLFVLLSLPMQLSLFAAVSQDGLMLAATALAVAVAARHPPPRHAGAAMIVLSAALGMVCIGRPAYAPLAILPMLLPGYAWRTRGTATLSVIAAMLSWSAIAARYTMVNAAAGRNVHPQAQWLGLIAHPGGISGLVRHAVTDRQGMEGLLFYQEFVGVLGWLDVVLPGWFYIFAIIVILTVAISQVPRRACGLSAAAKCTLAALMLCAVVLLFLFEYLTVTPVGFPWVQGVQGRYFLPVALFAPLIIPHIRRAALGKPARAAQWAVLAFPAISVAVTITSVVRRYYV